MVWEILIVFFSSFDSLIHDRILPIFLCSLYVTNFRPSESNSSIEIELLNCLETLPVLGSWFWCVYVCLCVLKYEQRTNYDYYVDIY